MAGFRPRPRQAWSPERRTEALAAIGRALGSVPGVRFGVVFGSFARRVAEQAGLSGLEVDVLPLEVADPFLRLRVAREGKVVFERQRWLYPAFYSRALIEGGDLLGALRRARHPMAGRHP